MGVKVGCGANDGRMTARIRARVEAERQLARAHDQEIDE